MFPLTASFAAISNNSTVAMKGVSVLIGDTLTPTSDTYYECDARVRSEFCCPIFNAAGTSVIGIIDAESFIPNFFTAGRIAGTD